MSVRERHKRERRARSDAILGAALRVFGEHGLEHSTIEMIAREAEVAVGTIYLYFSSRDDLFLSLLVERVAQLRERYLEIQAAGLAPLDELREIAAAYLEHIRESREMFLSQQSAGWGKLSRRIKRASELRNYKRVLELSQEVFGLWERTIARVIDAGLIANAMGPAKTAAVMWASINGAFMLLGDDNFFRDITGLDPEHFMREALESHLVGDHSLGVVEDRNTAGTAVPLRKKIQNGNNGGAGNGRAEKIKESEAVAARA
jgi:AcrR family transcriptional regulator